MGKSYKERQESAAAKLVELGVDVRIVNKREEIKKRKGKDWIGTGKYHRVFSHYELRVRGIRKVFRTQDKPSVHTAYGSCPECVKERCPYITLRIPEWVNLYYDESTKTWDYKPPWEKS
jgi:hypothetical protein